MCWDFGKNNNFKLVWFFPQSFHVATWCPHISRLRVSAMPKREADSRSSADTPPESQNRHLVCLDGWLWRWCMIAPYPADVTLMITEWERGCPLTGCLHACGVSGPEWCVTQWPRNGTASPAPPSCSLALHSEPCRHRGPWRRRTETGGKPRDSHSDSVISSTLQWREASVIILDTVKLLSLFRSKLGTKAL